MFNPQPRVEVLPIAGGADCLVIDDALLEPERMVALAGEHRDAFEWSPHNAYPGPELRMPDALSARLDEFFARHVRARLGARRTLRMYSRLALATRAPHELDPRQWICHRDRIDPDTGAMSAASVLYLFRDETLGGTSFFVPRRPKPQIDRLLHDSGVMRAEQFTARYGIRPGYQTDSNDWFEKVLTVPPKWNRIIFYDGGVFHCGDVRAPERLSADPRVGRLSLNGFFTCRRTAS